MHLDPFGMFVCLSVRVRNCITLALIDLIFLHKKKYTHGLVRIVR